MGEDSLSKVYSSVNADDIPIAEDYLGDQFRLRSKSVLRLHSETGEVEDLGVGWREFFSTAADNPTEFLSLQLLERFRSEGGSLEPGRLLDAYPPLCTRESANGVSLRAIPALQRLRCLADFAAQIAGLSDGSKIRMIIRSRE